MSRFPFYGPPFPYYNPYHRNHFSNFNPSVHAPESPISSNNWLSLVKPKVSWLDCSWTSETLFHKGSLRSGQRIEVEGSIVVIGDVNSGAEVIAADNIIVIGKLRGLAHAGAKGNKEAIIAASTLDAVQLRISNIVREIDREQEGIREYAYIYVKEDNIVIE